MVAGSDRVGALTAAFPPELVDLAIDEWDAWEERVRILPARLMAYFAMVGQSGATLKNDIAVRIWIRD